MSPAALFLLAAQGFAGAPSCAACHPGIAQTQARTHHASALARTGDGRWAFGAGVQAITYVSQAGEDSYLEHGLSWYRKTGGLALTPGHRDPRGVAYSTFAPDAAILRCFQCHSTGALRLSEAREILPAEPGVRCEACHGAGGAHVARPSPQNIVSPKRLSATAINDLCGACHRMPPATGVATNFENPWNVRHQPVYFSQSACFSRSGGGLSCISCHDPHQETPPAGDVKCKECHAQPKHTGPRAGGCTECHMPAVSPSPWLRFTNHWIGVYRLEGPGANRLRPVAQRRGR